MSDFSDFFGGGGGGRLRYSEFLASGTFTPPATLVANGGQCWALVVGGGGGAVPGGGNYIAGGGGAVRMRPLTITAAQTITIGAGGSAAGGAGGTSSIGSLLSSDGGRSGGFAPGIPGGGYGAHIGLGVLAPGPGTGGYGAGGLVVGAPFSAPPANTGCGGHSVGGTATVGASGYVRIWWYE